MAVARFLGRLRRVEKGVGIVVLPADGQHELALLVGAAGELLHQDAVGGFREQAQAGEARVRQPLADLAEALGDDRKRDAGRKQRGDLARRREIAEAVAAVLGLR